MWPGLRQQAQRNADEMLTAELRRLVDRLGAESLSELVDELVRDLPADGPDRQQPAGTLSQAE